MSCNNSKERIKARAAGIVLVAAYDRWQNNDFTLASILKESWELSKHQFKNNKNVRKDVFDYLKCWLDRNLA